MHRNYAEKGCHLYPVVEHTSDLNNVVTATSDLRAERRKCHSTLSVFFFFLSIYANEFFNISVLDLVVCLCLFTGLNLVSEM